MQCILRRNIVRMRHVLSTFPTFPRLIYRDMQNHEGETSTCSLHINAHCVELGELNGNVKYLSFFVSRLKIRKGLFLFQYLKITCWNVQLQICFSIFLNVKASLFFVTSLLRPKHIFSSMTSPNFLTDSFHSNTKLENHKSE